MGEKTFGARQVLYAGKMRPVFSSRSGRSVAISVYLTNAEHWRAEECLTDDAHEGLIRPSWR